jgi:stage V sporulation protein G
MGNLILDKVHKETGEVIGTMALEIRTYPIAEPKGSTKGYASITIDDMFGVHGVAVVEGKNGMFVQMPQTRDGKGAYRDIFHPVTPEGRAALQEAVLTDFGVSLDAMVTQKESVVQKLRDAASAAKGQAAPIPAKEPKEKAAKKTEPER